MTTATTNTTNTTNTRARARARSVDKTAEPPVEGAKYTATLRRGLMYRLCSRDDAPDIIFKHGVTVAIDEQTYHHLAEHAVDKRTMIDGADRVDQLVRKFSFSPPLPRIKSQRRLGAVQGDEDDDQYLYA